MLLPYREHFCFCKQFLLTCSCLYHKQNVWFTFNIILLLPLTMMLHILVSLPFILLDSDGSLSRQPDNTACGTLEKGLWGWVMSERKKYGVTMLLLCHMIDTWGQTYPELFLRIFEYFKKVCIKFLAPRLHNSQYWVMEWVHELGTVHMGRQQRWLHQAHVQGKDDCVCHWHWMG